MLDNVLPSWTPLAVFALGIILLILFALTLEKKKVLATVFMTLSLPTLLATSVTAETRDHQIRDAITISVNNDYGVHIEQPERPQQAPGISAVLDDKTVPVTVTVNDDTYENTYSIELDDNENITLTMTGDNTNAPDPEELHDR